MKNVVYVISDTYKSLAFEWVADYLNRQKFNLIFILINGGDSKLESELLQKNIKTYRINHHSVRNVISTWYSCKRILKKEKADIVHCHLLKANLFGLSTAKILGIRKRIYTRHHSTLYHVYHPKGKIYDKLANFFATHIIAISSNVKKVLTDLEKVDSSKIRLVHHGFDLKLFQIYNRSEVELLKIKYKINNEHPIIGVISRYTHWKGVQYIIPAFKKFLLHHPNALLVLANASGDYRSTIENLLKELPSHSYREIEFEQKIYDLYSIFDIFVHVPVDDHSEAFGQTYIEAMASQVPSIFTKSGIGNEICEHKKNCILVSYKDSDHIYEAMNMLFFDKNLQNTITQEGSKTAGLFSINKMIAELEKIYNE